MSTGSKMSSNKYLQEVQEIDDPSKIKWIPAQRVGEDDFEMFLAECYTIESSNEMEYIIRKLKKRFRKAEKKYTESKKFRKLVLWAYSIVNKRILYSTMKMVADELSDNIIGKYAVLKDKEPLETEETISEYKEDAESYDKTECKVVLTDVQFTPAWNQYVVRREEQSRFDYPNNYNLRSIKLNQISIICDNFQIRLNRTRTTVNKGKNSTENDNDAIEIITNSDDIITLD